MGGGEPSWGEAPPKVYPLSIKDSPPVGVKSGCFKVVSSYTDSHEPLLHRNSVCSSHHFARIELNTPFKPAVGEWVGEWYGFWEDTFEPHFSWISPRSLARKNVILRDHTDTTSNHKWDYKTRQNTWQINKVLMDTMLASNKKNDNYK